MNKAIRRITDVLVQTTMLTICTGYLFMTVWVFTSFKEMFVDSRGFVLSAGYAATWPFWLAPAMADNYRAQAPR